MARFIIRNYGPSRQFPYKGNSICLSNDQCIETDDAEEAATLQGYEKVHVCDRGVEHAAPVPLEKPDEDKKERKVTVDDVEAVHAEKHPDDVEQPQEMGGTQAPPPNAEADKDEIAYAEMSVKELQVLAKDRQLPIKTSGLNKAALIEALQAYDAEPDKPVEPEIETVK